VTIQNERLEADRVLLIAVLSHWLYQNITEVWPDCEPSQLIVLSQECQDERTSFILSHLRPYLAAMGVDVESPEMKAAFSERLKSAADVMERILRHQIEAARPEDPSS